MRAPLLGRFRSAFDQQRLNLIHGGAKILAGSCPSRRVNARFAVKRIDDQTGVVGECRFFTCPCGRQRLDARIGGKARSGFLRLGQAELGSGVRVDAVRGEQLAHFPELAWIMGSDHHHPGELSAHITAIFCKLTSFSMPLRASASNAANGSSLNGVFSAVAWISTMLPDPVI